MRAAEIVGGLAVVGVAVLIGLAIVSDDDPAMFQTEEGSVLFQAGSTSTSVTTTLGASTTTGTLREETSTPTSTAESAPARTSTDGAGTQAPTTSDVAITTTTTPTTTSPPSSTVATIPEDERGSIAVRVLNAGVEEGAATFVSGVLRQSGFAPLQARDAPARAEVTTVLYEPGRVSEATTVNAVIEADPRNVRPREEDDPSWAEFGEGLHVLVLLGPD